MRGIWENVLLSSTFYIAGPCTSCNNNLFNITSSALPIFLFYLFTISLNKFVQTTQTQKPKQSAPALHRERAKQYSENINLAIFSFPALCLWNLFLCSIQTESLSSEDTTQSCLFKAFSAMSSNSEILKDAQILCQTGVFSSSTTVLTLDWICCHSSTAVMGANRCLAKSNREEKGKEEDGGTAKHPWYACQV